MRRLDEVAVRRPEAKRMDVDELIDSRFVKELEDSGFCKVTLRRQIGFVVAALLDEV